MSLKASAANVSTFCPTSSASELAHHQGVRKVVVFKYSFCRVNPMKDDMDADDDTDEVKEEGKED